MGKESVARPPSRRRLWQMTRQQFELELDDAGGVRHAAGVYRRIGSPSVGPRDSAPRVDFSARDLQDVADDPTEIDLLKAYAEHPSDVYAAYVPIELVPAPVLAEEVAASEAMSDCAARQRELGWPDPGEDGYENCDDLYADSYDWDSLRMARSTPPAKLRVTRRGAVEILDGNHRVALWGERGFTHVPAWVIDERGHRAAVAAALAAGRRVPEAVRASYPDLLPTRPNPPPKGTRVSAHEEMGELWVEARSAEMHYWQAVSRAAEKNGFKIALLMRLAVALPLPLLQGWSLSPATHPCIPRILQAAALSPPALFPGRRSYSPCPFPPVSAG